MVHSCAALEVAVPKIDLPKIDLPEEGPVSNLEGAASVRLDLRHLRCPMPVLRTRKALALLDPGSILVVECTDPLAGLDIPHLVSQTDDVLIAQALEHGVQIFTIRKG